MRTYSDLIRSTCFSEVPHPLDAIVVTLLEHLQESHDQTGGRVHQNLKINVNRRTGPYLSSGSACKLGSSREGHFLTSLNAGNPNGDRY